MLHGQQQSLGCAETFRQLAEVVRRLRDDTVGQLVGQQGEYLLAHRLFVHHPADHVLVGEEGRAQQSVIVFFDGDLRIVQRGEREQVAACTEPVRHQALQGRYGQDLLL